MLFLIKTLSSHSLSSSSNRPALADLWLEYKFNVIVNNENISKSSRPSLLRTSTHFKIYHQGQTHYGPVISCGFPCTPIITQATIVDDKILGHSRLWVKYRMITYLILIGLLLAIYHG